MLSGGESYGKTGAVLGGAGVAAEKGEGVTLKENGCVDLKKYLWEC